MTPHSTVQPESADFDTGPLSWVMKEIREALQRSRNLLDEALAQAPEAQATSLRQARAFLHQAHGALQIVDIDGVGLVTEALERMLDQALEGKPALTAAALAIYGEATLALVEYLEELLSGASHQPVRLYPYYKAVQAACGNDKSHPSDLFFPNLAIRPQLAGEQQGRPLDFGALRQHFERALLPFLRSTDAAACKAAATQMATVVAQVERAQGNADARRFWWVLRGFVEGVALGEIAPEVHVRQLFGRINLQLRKLAQGETVPVERLLRDALFFIAAASRPSGRTAQVQSAYQLAGQISGDYETKRYGRLDQSVLAEARERLSQAKTLWARLVNGDASLAAEFEKQMQALASAGARLHAPALEKLLRELNGIARAAHSQPGEALALEMASSLLFVESALQHASRLSESFAQRAEALSARLLAVVAGEQPDASTQWLDDLSRDTQQKETVAVLAGEMRTSLNQVEKGLEEFFSDGSQRAGLAKVDQILHQIEGALAILEQDEASQAIADTRAAVAQMRKLPGEESASPAEAQRVARNLGALSFFLETLQVQASAARERFAFDAASRSFAERMVDPASRAALEVVVDPLPESLPAAGAGSAAAAPLPAAAPVSAPAPAVPMLDAVLGSDVPAPVPAVSPNAATSSAANTAPGATAITTPHGAADTLKPNLSAGDGQAPAANTAQTTSATDAALAACAPSTSASPPDLSASDADIDAELLDIFLGEAEEVLACVRETLPELVHNHASIEHLTTVRRCFHTLKGSGRMVGLVEFGEAAWAVEQTLNLLLADGKPVNRDVQGLLHAAADLLEAWVEDLRTHGSSQCRPDFIVVAARLVREGGAFVLATQVQAGAEDAPAIAAVAGSSTPEPGAAQATRVDGDDVPTIEALEADAYNVEIGPQANSADVDFTLTVGAEPADHEAAARVDKSTEQSADESTEESELPPLDFSDLLPPGASSEQPTLDQPDTRGIETVDLSFDLDSGALDLAPASTAAESTASTAPADATVTELPTLALHAVESGTLQATAVKAEGDESVDASPDSTDAVTQTATPSDTPSDTPSGTQFASDLASIPDAPGPSISVPARAEVIDLAAVRSAPEPRADDNIKRIGSLEISLPLYKIYLAETDDLVRLLGTDLDEWRHEPDRMVHTASVHAAHSLSGSSATVGCEPVHELAHALELILQALVRRPVQLLGSDFLLMQDTVARMKDMLATFARGEMPQAESALAAALEGRLADFALRPGLFDHHEPAAAPTPATLERAAQVAAVDLAGIPATPLPADELDADLLPVFLEEGGDMLPQIGRGLRDWQQEPQVASHPAQLLRLLHTVKGSARMAGAMALGQHMHDMESRIEQLARHGAPARDAIEELSNRLDTALAMFERLQAPAASAAAAITSTATAEQPIGALAPVPTLAQTPLTALAELDTPLAKAGPGPSVPLVRVRADVLDRLVNQAGEVSIARSRAETEIDGLRNSLSDLTENVARLRNQLREIEIQAESQMSSHMALASEREFDPLEFDRFTRLQELTRMMAESVSDVASLQGTLTRTLDNTGAALNNQARLTRDLQQDLMQVRMVQFGSIAERLYRVTRQAAKETDKRINLDLRGASVELDRGVLEKMAGPFEHLLRNAIVHGIETRAERLAAGKPETGEIQVEVRQEGNEIVLQFADDGRGLDLARIGAKARKQGLLGADQSVSDEELRELIFHAGFTTAEEVTALAGRGVGMDAVRSEAVALGGRIAVQSEAGRGACFQVRLPLTLAVTQVVLLSAGGRTYAVPSVLVEQVQQLKSQPLAAAYNDNGLAWLGQRVPLHYLPALLGDGVAMPVTQQYSPVVIMRSAQERIAIHVDEVVGNREVVVKNVGPQLSRLAGVAGATVLGSGEVVLILNPVPLAQRATAQPMRAPRLLAGDVPQDLGAVAELKSAGSAPVQGLRSQAVVMVVDDSLTVRRVTQRLLAREAYQVVLAKDGVEALEQLQSVTPDVMLVDIEMPRMDGFDLTRNVRSDARTRHIPIIMITSRTAEKHRNYAFELGVNEYLGKPFQELELLELVKGFVQRKERAASEA